MVEIHLNESLFDDSIIVIGLQCVVRLVNFFDSRRSTN